MQTKDWKPQFGANGPNLGSKTWAPDPSYAYFKAVWMASVGSCTAGVFALWGPGLARKAWEGLNCCLDLLGPSHASFPHIFCAFPLTFPLACPLFSNVTSWSWYIFPKSPSQFLNATCAASLGHVLAYHARPFQQGRLPRPRNDKHISLTKCMNTIEHRQKITLRAWDYRQYTAYQGQDRQRCKKEFPDASSCVRGKFAQKCLSV